LNVTEREALVLAAATMRQQAYLAEPMARDWRTHGEALQFNKQESRQAAEYADRLTEAANIIDALLSRTQ
jgi:hypothetical protein